MMVSQRVHIGDPAILFLGVHPRDLKTRVQIEPVLVCSQQHYLQYFKCGKSPDVHELINGYTATVRYP